MSLERKALGLFGPPGGATIVSEKEIQQRREESEKRLSRTIRLCSKLLESNEKKEVVASALSELKKFLEANKNESPELSVFPLDAKHRREIRHAALAEVLFPYYRQTEIQKEIEELERNIEGRRQGIQQIAIERKPNVGLLMTSGDEIAKWQAQLQIFLDHKHLAEEAPKMGEQKKQAKN